MDKIKKKVILSVSEGSASRKFDFEFLDEICDQEHLKMPLHEGSLCTKRCPWAHSYCVSLQGASCRCHTSRRILQCTAVCCVAWCEIPIKWLTQHMRQSFLAILAEPLWCFLPSTNNLDNYAWDQEVVLCNLNPGYPGDCFCIRSLMLAPKVLRFLWSISPILGSQGNNMFALKCTVKQSMKVPSAFTFKNSPFCHRSNHGPFGSLHWVQIAVYSFSLNKSLFCLGISSCNFCGNGIQEKCRLLPHRNISVNTSQYRLFPKNLLLDQCMKIYRWDVKEVWEIT
jgi:hypothetical protein